MNTALLKEAVARQSPAAAIVPVEALSTELAVFRRTIKDVAEQVARWRDEMKGLPELLPEVRAVAASIPEGERRFEEQISNRLDQFASRLQGTLSDWERHHDAELRKQDDRLQSLVDERAALAKMWERQGHDIRQEFLQERIARETAISDQVAELAKRLDSIDHSQREAGAGSASVREALNQVLRVVSATPKAKDEIIVELEAEKTELVRTMRERREQMQELLGERRAIEKSMGDSLITMSGELEKERGRVRDGDARLEQAKGLSSKISDLERALSERDSRALSIGAERDELTRALVAEADKVRLAIGERTASDERWHQRLLEMQRKVEDESARAGQEASATSDLRAKVATLSEHMARALQERDAVVARFADWERERQRLLDALKQKDGMVAMLSSAFQGSLKKP